MTLNFALEFLPTAIGSLPHGDAATACDLVQHFLPDLPAWPQLPKRDFRESIYAQYSRGFPGVVLEAERLYVDRSRDLLPEIEKLFTHYLANDFSTHDLTADYAAGFAHFTQSHFNHARAVKGQVIGPVSWGLVVTDHERRAILYDETLAEAIPRHLRLQAAWQEAQLRRLSPNTILFIDEPYLASFGSAYVAIDQDQVVTMLDEVFGGIQGLKGVHCCGNTDWSMLMATSVDIINFDAYNFAETFALYPTELRNFLNRGGALAWGIVPVGSDEQVLAETVENLTAKLVTSMKHIAAKGIPLELLLESALLTPACGMGTLSITGATKALELLQGVSQAMRKNFGK